jgi:hypothetical protein
MPSLDFKEIAQANLASGEQDTFEMLAREFLELLGFKAVSGPDRGADLGRDLIVLETRKGVGGETSVRWLVSCKHKAHSGQSVNLSDEQDIFDRVQTHSCDGFIGFYSTLPASSLTQKLDGIKNSHSTFDFHIFDREKIEKTLLATGSGQGIARRYFPNSYNRWSEHNFNIDIALARIGMPQPVAYRMPNEDKVITLEEARKLYPQGQRYIYNPWLPGNLIVSDNLLGITKLLGEGGELIDPPSDYFERMNESINLNIEAMRQHMLNDSKNVDGAAPASHAQGTAKAKKRKASKQNMAKESRKRNRKK